MTFRFANLLIVVGLVASNAWGQAATQPSLPIDRVRTFMYQLQNLEQAGAVDRLAKSDYDLLVVEPTSTVKGNEDFSMKEMVAALHKGKPGRIVLAYLNAGEAESYRSYWASDWKAPTSSKNGSPNFLLMADPDGWTDNYNVAYWNPRWQQMLVTGENSELQKIMSAGFDGVYLDWIDAYDDDHVVAAAKLAKVDPAKAMVDFLLLIRKTARQINPAAIVVQQNAYYLADSDPRWTSAVDAVGVEDTWFSGKANAKWGSKGAGDVPNRAKSDDDDSTAARLVQYKNLIAAGKPVLTIDYCRKPENAAKVYREAAANGLVPLVTQVSLDQMTETPPTFVTLPTSRPSTAE